jgi:hypothetical protein
VYLVLCLDVADWFVFLGHFFIGMSALPNERSFRYLRVSLLCSYSVLSRLATHQLALFGFILFAFLCIVLAAGSL